MREDGKPALRLDEARDEGRIPDVGIAVDAQSKEVEAVVASELEAGNHEERGIRKAPAFVDEVGHLLRLKRV
jgi:hypothetical protein